MLVLAGTNQYGNMLHLVLGAESEFWMGLHGAVLANVTQALNTMDQSLPVFVHVTRCESETELAELIAMNAQSGNPYPFHITTNVFAQTHGKQDPTAKGPAVPSASGTKQGSATGGGRCARCGGRHTELVPKISPPICYECLHLDMMLASVRRDAGDTPNGEADESDATKSE